jgi:pimeloyl-ACP methyl ester carboxylesterase
VTAYAKDSVYFLGGAGRLAGDCWTPETGNKGTVLLLHGGGQTRHSWRAAGPTLAEDGWTTFAIDFRGHGDSDWAADGQYGLDAMVEDLNEVLQSLPTPPVIVGASLGGLTGLIIAGEQPTAVRGLVLVDAVPRIEPAGAQRIASFMRSAPEGFESLEEVAEAIREYQPQRVRPINLEGLRKNVRRGANGRWFWHWDPAFLRPLDNAGATLGSARIAAAAAKVQVPTLLVRGALSDVVAEEGVSDLLATIPQARHVDVANTGHMVAGDDNSVFLSRVGDFLDEVVAA